MEAFFAKDPLSVGSKGLVYVGDEIVVYRRGWEAGIVHPGELDLPGGAPEGDETPFETFCREVYEEFRLKIVREHIVYARRHASQLQPGKFAWHSVAKLPASAKNQIVFGDEGSEWMLMTPDAYLARQDAWPIFQERTAAYLTTLAT